MFGAVLEEANGRSKGCGLVEYGTEDEANCAIATLNNTELEGRLIFVREDREPDGGSISKIAKRQSPLARGGGDGRQLYVGNVSAGVFLGFVFGLKTELMLGCVFEILQLPWNTNWQQLKDLFRTVGEVERADIAELPDGRSRGFGIIRFTNPTHAWQAIGEKATSDELNLELC